MLKIIVSLDEYKPWSGAKWAYEKILEEDKLDNFEAYMEDLYPDGLTDTELNDILWFAWEEIFEDLGMEVQR